MLNKGFVKLGLLLGVVLGLVGLIGYLVSAENTAAHETTTICHVPPGNPDNSQTLELDENGLNGHKTNRGKLHGLDYYGECGGEGEPEEFQRPYVTVEQACGYIKLSFHNPTSWLFVFDYRVDGEPYVDESPYFPGQYRWHLVPLVGKHNEDRTFAFDEDSGTHLVEWRLAEGAEQDYYFDWTSAEIETDCEINLVPVCTDKEALNYGGEDGEFNEETEVSDNELCEHEEVTPTPTPTPTPTEQPTLTSTGGNEALRCTDSTPLMLPSNVHVVRNGSDATVNFFSQSSNANIYYRTSGQPVWEHSVRDIPVVGGYVSYTIHDLNPTGDYDFGVQSANSCAGGEVVLAVVEDDYTPRTFGFSWWEWLR